MPPSATQRSRTRSHPSGVSTTSHLYGRTVRPTFARYCELFTRSSDAHRHSTRLRYDGIPLVAAVLAAGTLALEGEVDETQMGDW